MHNQSSKLSALEYIVLRPAPILTKIPSSTSFFKADSTDEEQCIPELIVLTIRSEERRVGKECL